MSNYKIPALKQSIFSTQLEVRIYDINYGNHLGYDSLVSLLHESRTRFLKSIGYSELNIHDRNIFVTNLVVNYINEAFYMDKLLIKLGLGKISKASLEIIYQIDHIETDKEIARGLTTIAFYDYQSAKVVKIPNQFLESISALIKYHCD